MDAAVQVDRVGGLLFITITEWEDGCCCFNQWFRVSAMVKCYIPGLFISQTVINSFSSELNEKKKKNSFFIHCFSGFFLVGLFFFFSSYNVLIKLLMWPKMKPCGSLVEDIWSVIFNCWNAVPVGRLAGIKKGTWLWTTRNLISPLIRTCHVISTEIHHSEICMSSSAT